MYGKTGYGIPVDPALYRRAIAGPGIGARLDSGLRSFFGGASPVTSPAYGVGAMTSPSMLAAIRPDMPERLRSPSMLAAIRPDMPERLRSPSMLAAIRPHAPQALTSMLPVPSSLTALTAQSGGLASFSGRPATTPGALGYADKAETAGMSQQQATAYNVAGIESQINALRQLREARNPGVNGQGNGTGQIDMQDLARQANPFYQPGQNYGDEVLDRDRYMRQFADTRRGQAQRQQAEMGLAELGNARLQNLLGTAVKQQQGQQDLQGTLAAVRQKALADQRDYALGQQKIGVDQNRLQFEIDRAGITDAAKQRLDSAAILRDYALGQQKIGVDQDRLQFEIDRAGITDAAKQQLDSAAILRDIAAAGKAAQERQGMLSEQGLLDALQKENDPTKRDQLLQVLLAARGRQFDPALTLAQ